MGSTKYTIKPGDNLSTIASKYGTTVDAIAKANGISNPNRIYANSVITIPNATVSGALQDAINKGTAIDTDAAMYKGYDPYKESDTVTALGTKKTEAENAVANYGDFAWDQQGKYDNLIKEYENRGDFSYDFNADALYQQYKDKYIQQGKLAMADAIGQASAMTGGYGNSYAATVGNQAYQGYLNQLNDVIPELYQMAYDRYNQKGQDMLNTIALLGNERDFAYGQWGDRYNQLVSDRSYYGSQYDDERSWEYGVHTDKQNYEYGLSRDRIEDTQWKANFDEGLRQFNEQMAFEREQYNDSKIVSPSENNPTTKKETSDNKQTQAITPTETKATNSFIANHQTKDEYMRRGKNYKQFKEYIDAEIDKVQDSLSDEELMYLKQYYGL